MNEHVRAGTAALAGIRVTEWFLRQVAPAVSGVKPREEDGDTARVMHAQGYFLRALHWVGSITKLDGAADYQAITAGARSLLEIAIDTTLMRHEADAHEKIYEWERSAKLKASERARAALNGRDPCGYKPLIDFADNVERTQSIREARERLWNRQGHPQRWTGHNLDVDAERADTHLEEPCFADFYSFDYAQMCFNTHGSAFAGVRGISQDTFAALASVAFTQSDMLAQSAAQNVLEELGMFDATTFDVYRAERTRAIDSVLAAG